MRCSGWVGAMKRTSSLQRVQRAFEVGKGPAPGRKRARIAQTGVGEFGRRIFEASFTSALGWHAQTLDSFETARTRLAYGSRLRRVGRRVDARSQLRAALDAFSELGAAVWRDQAAAELTATGRTCAGRRDSTRSPPCTPQELQVSLLLAEGRTTREAAAALFLSPKTVEYHLRKVYTKLGIGSRGELADVLGGARRCRGRRRRRTLLVVARRSRHSLIEPRSRNFRDVHECDPARSFVIGLSHGLSRKRTGPVQKQRADLQTYAAGAARTRRTRRRGCHKRNWSYALEHIIRPRSPRPPSGRTPHPPPPRFRRGGACILGARGRRIHGDDADVSR